MAETYDDPRKILMKRFEALLSVLGCLLTSACPQSGEPGTGPVGQGSSSGTDADPTASTPTSSGETGAVTTEPISTSTSTTSGVPDSSSTAMAESSSGAGSSSSEATAASEATGGSTADCGNGLLDPGEGCDDGYAANSDDSECTLACQPAKCGDGLVWAGHELCDLGNNNNDTAYDGCTYTCEPGPHCGDSVVQGPEECDLGSDNGAGLAPDGGVACELECHFDAKLVFVSSEAYIGGEIGGVEGADLKCQELAMKAGLDNGPAFKAYISDDSSSPFSSFTKSSKPYVLRNGIRVADNWTDLLVTPNPGITLSEMGVSFEARWVWTGTTPSGNKFPDQTCKNWTSSDPEDQGRIGTSSATNLVDDWLNEKEWVSESSLGCDLQARLYCVEQ